MPLSAEMKLPAEPPPPSAPSPEVAREAAPASLSEKAPQKPPRDAAGEVNGSALPPASVPKKHSPPSSPAPPLKPLAPLPAAPPPSAPTGVAAPPSASPSPRGVDVARHPPPTASSARSTTTAAAAGVVVRASGGRKSEVAQWLEEHDLGGYAAAFAADGYDDVADVAALAAESPAVLARLVPLDGHRRKITRLLAARRPPPPPTAAAPSPAPAPSVAPLGDGIAAAFKVLLVGAPGVGKTSLVRLLVEGNFASPPRATLGVEFREFVAAVALRSGPAAPPPLLYKVQLWDIGGQDGMFAAASRFFYVGAHAILVCYDVSRPETLAAAAAWRADAARRVPPQCVAILLGLKADLTRLAKPDDPETMATAGGGYLAAYEVSCKYGRDSSLAPIRRVIREVLSQSPQGGLSPSDAASGASCPTSPRGAAHSGAAPPFRLTAVPVPVKQRPRC